MEISQRTAKYQRMREMLNEKQWRHYVALEAQERGAIKQIAHDAQVSSTTIRRGLREIAAGEHYQAGDKQRKDGGGRKTATTHAPNLLEMLESRLDPKGDPMSFLKWTTKSVVHLQLALQAHGYTISATTIRRLLHHLGYSLRANKKNIEGISHPDRDAQFAHIAATCQEFEQHGAPIISVDCKKKELIGHFKNQGRDWASTEQHTEVNVYDFLSLADGKAIPYGVYDLVHNHGFVNVGIDHDTAAFAVESIKRWWQQYGKTLYPNQSSLLITADGGGSNGVRNRLWKQQLQAFATEAHITIRVAHYPPATSKWNKIEHRLFSFISINWRATPLTSFEVVLELLSHTTTKAGLTVTAQKDSNTYPTGIKVTDEQLAALSLVKEEFHGEWNYTIFPHSSR